MHTSSYVVYLGVVLRRRAFALVTLLLGVLVPPGAAFAHGIHGTGNESVGAFGWIGVKHMLADWDHLLFRSCP
jgi:hypothetical protein